MRIGVCLRWVDLAAEVDPLSGSVSTQPRTSGFSSADEAALETALLLAEKWNADVVVISAGGAEVEASLRVAAASGASAMRRVECADVARGLAHVAADCDLIFCGDVSLDGGSGSTPALLAYHRGAAAALGLTSVEAGSSVGTVTGIRRLGAGRSERIEVSAPAVISVEGSVARLRRAPLSAVLANETVAIDVSVRDAAPPERGMLIRRVGWRPRPRVVAPPEGSTRDRVVALTGALVDRTPPRRVELDPKEAAAAIIDQLRTWGYLDRGDD